MSAAAKTLLGDPFNKGGQRDTAARFLFFSGMGALVNLWEAGEALAEPGALYCLLRCRFYCAPLGTLMWAALSALL